MANGAPSFPEQAMGRMEALYSCPLGCAEAVFDKDELGSLTPGNRADIPLLNGNPLTVDDDALSGLRVEMMLTDGEVHYRTQ